MLGDYTINTITPNTHVACMSTGCLGLALVNWCVTSLLVREQEHWARAWPWMLNAHVIQWTEKYLLRHVCSGFLTGPFPRKSLSLLWLVWLYCTDRCGKLEGPNNFHFFTSQFRLYKDGILYYEPYGLLYRKRSSVWQKY